MMPRFNVVLRVMMTPDLQELRARIRTIREQKGYSQEYMAAKLGLGQNGYSKMELGKTRLTVGRLLEVCALLEVEVSVLF